MSHEPKPTRLRLDALLGQKVPGGCADCDAYQTMHEVDGVYVLGVHHDDWCPTLAVHPRARQPVTTRPTLPAADPTTAAPWASTVPAADANTHTADAVRPPGAPLGCSTAIRVPAHPAPATATAPPTAATARCLPGIA